MVRVLVRSFLTASMKKIVVIGDNLVGLGFDGDGNGNGVGNDNGGGKEDADADGHFKRCNGSCHCKAVSFVVSCVCRVMSIYFIMRACSNILILVCGLTYRILNIKLKCCS